MKLRQLLVFVSAFALLSCNNTPNVPEQVQQVETVRNEESVTVQKTLISKGVIKSVNEIEVFSTIDGHLKEVKLIEGDKVKRGQTIFQLEDAALQSALLVSELEYEKAKLATEEILIGQGYQRDHLDEVPEEVMNYATTKSGLKLSELDLSIKQHNCNYASITAPQSGLIANIQKKSYAYVEAGETLCTIVDPDHLYVEFSILETELRNFQIGTEIEVYSLAYSNISHKATVRSIGSIVGADGMIKVEALLADTENLMPGMTAIINL